MTPSILNSSDSFTCTSAPLPTYSDVSRLGIKSFRQR